MESWVIKMAGMVLVPVEEAVVCGGVLSGCRRPGPADHGVKTGRRGPCCMVLHVYIYPCIVLCKTRPIQ
jgi:hypothetical protein